MRWLGALLIAGCTTATVVAPTADGGEADLDYPSALDFSAVDLATADEPLTDDLGSVDLVNADLIPGANDIAQPPDLLMCLGPSQFCANGGTCCPGTVCSYNQPELKLNPICCYPNVGQPCAKTSDCCNNSTDVIAICSNSVCCRKDANGVFQCK